MILFIPVNILMYADDTTLFSTYDKFENIDNKNIETIQYNINKELLLIIVAWLHSNKLLINTAKTKTTTFHTPHCVVKMSALDIYPKSKINNSSAEIVDEFKFFTNFYRQTFKVVNSYLVHSYQNFKNILG